MARRSGYGAYARVRAACAQAQSVPLGGPARIALTAACCAREHRGLLHLRILIHRPVGKKKGRHCHRENNQEEALEQKVVLMSIESGSGLGDWADAFI